MNNKKYNTRYGISDIVIDSEIELPKNIEIYDKGGNLITETEIYFIDTEFNVAEVHGFNTILGVITVEYIRRPLPVNWGYIEVNGAALYEPVSSVNFELHNSEQTDIVFKILALAGISIKNPELYQAGTVEDAKSTQQQIM